MAIPSRGGQVFMTRPKPTALTRLWTVGGEVTKSAGRLRWKVVYFFGWSGECGWKVLKPNILEIRPRPSNESHFVLSISWLHHFFFLSLEKQIPVFFQFLPSGCTSIALPTYSSSYPILNSYYRINPHLHFETKSKGIVVAHFSWL